ncbi:MAG: phosphoglycerate mutase (2,3-diphosphoglycerate-independent) [Candidatus Woykebacteria bacterium RBG_13_40_15]|uniref:2,3-bisphosphoglycerate-independent phosphoglycerate mutase n=1 Tax=Candidatus Woykebacteria bacterium RBG_13_40_15 TaxID=1802593 RepID=A0A1G1W784_9BACT|nr:MAG: phosphoglycerate mutase (2,3-diphosphoglycerate-independent) [Candidatus Woykebacteria bacterium RBG_13_40_15]
MSGVRPVILIILDGWGVANPGPGNAISLAKKPFWDKISVAYPNTTLLASGEAVGLPIGEEGNSEVGHLNIGAGRIVYQGLPRINMSIAEGSFLENKAFCLAAQKVKERESALHLMGLVGRGEVHSCLEHLYGLLWFAKSQNISNVFVHAFTDGRDSSPTSGKEIIEEINRKISEIGVGKLATVMGRYLSMDRNNHWDRTKKSYDALVGGKGLKVKNPLEAIEKSYKNEVTDEFIEPIIISDGDEPCTIKDGDSIIFFNFRPDRARQLTRAFADPSFNNFTRDKVLKDITFVTMTEYEKNLPVIVGFPSSIVDFPLAAVLSVNNLRQLHIGETEKYAHVTYFINGGREEPFPGEDRIHIPSPKVATYDKQPEMSAKEITDKIVDRVKNGLYDAYIVNFANCDMVGHTGSIEATIKAVETVDSCLAQIVATVFPLGGAVVITADHGNAENMTDPVTGKINTEHTGNPVPFIAISKQFEGKGILKIPSGILADVSPTVLNLLGLDKPAEMTGKSLI